MALLAQCRINTDEKELSPMSEVALKNPDILDEIPDEIDERMHTEIATLPVVQQRIMIALVGNILAEKPLTDKQIAVELGTSRSYIGQCRAKPRFARCLSSVVRDIATGTADKAIQHLMRAAEKDTKAIDIWLRIADVFRPTQRNVNINARVNATDAGITSENAIDMIFSRLIATGWTEERFIAKVRQLKSEGIH